MQNNMMNFCLRNTRRIAILGGIAAAAFCAPQMALAAFSTAGGLSAGEIAQNVSRSSSGIYAMLNDGAMLLGFVLVLLGLWMFYQSKKDEGRTKMSYALTAVIIGSLMIFIPFVIESTGKTLGGSTNLRQAPTTSIQ